MPHSLQATVASELETLSDLDALMPTVYARLSILARSARRSVGPAPTLNTTALVNEAYLRLRAKKKLDVSDKHAFYALCAKTMRGILIDHARAKATAKRQKPPDLEMELSMESQTAEDLVAVDEILTEIASQSPRLVQLVECIFFAGYSQAETAEVLGVSERTVRRDWLKAKALMARAL